MTDIINYQDYWLSLKEKENKNVFLDIGRPLYLRHEGIGYSVETLRNIVDYVFKLLPESTCKTIEFGFYKFEREGSELDFYKEVSKRISFY